MPSLPGSSSVAVVGELLVDIVHTPDGHTAEHVGGSPANVAIGLARLGHRTALATVVGTDPRGVRCADHVRAAGVELTTGSVSAGHSTSTAAASLDATGAASYLFDLHWDLPEVALAPDTGHVHTGSIAATLVPGADEVLATVERVRESATISYDPNARPTIMGDPESVRPRMEALVARADVVKCSDDDLAWLYPDEDIDAIAARWGASGPALVLVTQGASGVRWWLSHEPEGHLTPAERVPVADTVGAGDSFMAGLVSGLLDAGLLGGPNARAALHRATPDQVRPAVERGRHTSAITVTHAGAYAPTREELTP